MKIINKSNMEIGKMPPRLRFAIWLCNKVNFGRLTPWVFGLCLGSIPRKVEVTKELEKDDFK
jgi:hypothetical protein